MSECLGIRFEDVVHNVKTTSFTWCGIEFEVTKGYFPPKTLSAKNVKYKHDKTRFARRFMELLVNSGYDYSEFEYFSANSTSTIICSLHGRFQKSFSNHVRGQGCLKCSRLALSKKRQKTFNDFVLDSTAVHGNRYKYIGDYSGSGVPTKILCRVHGEFFQTPENHLVGQGCPTCGTITAKRKLKARGLGGWKKSHYCKLSSRSCLYLIKLFDGVNSFYKIGIAKSIRRRLTAIKRGLGFEPELVLYFEGDSGKIWDLERRLHKMFFSSRYKPKKVFVGHTECFTDVDINKLKITAEQYLKEI